MPFSGEISARWSADGRHMMVIEPVTFTDKAGRAWHVPASFTTDGASIPQALWALVGSPFTGRYRTAAVFHDAAYRTLGVTKKDADRMFHEAMLESGVDPILARVILEGVELGGLEPYAAAQRAAAEIAPH